MDVEHKKTVLNDEAALYHHDENVSEKEKWSRMSGKERWEYFKSYYLMKCIAVIASVAVVVSIFYAMFSPKPEVVLNVAIVNQALVQPQYLELQEAFETWIELDSETQETVFDGGYDFELDQYNALQKFAIYNAAGELDVTILPLSEFERYAPVGYFSQVSNQISTGLYLKLSDYFIESSRQNENGEIEEGTTAVYGIRIDSTRIFEGYEVSEPVVLAINHSTGNEEMIERFLTYLFFEE